MIFFVGNDGTIIKSLPSPVYQGGANTNDITLIAPFANGLTAAVAFQLPNGVAVAPAPMTYQAEIEGIVNKETGETYSGWTYSLPSNITEYYGTVTAQFYFYAETDGAVTATSATSFQVAKGVPAVLPSEPSADVYEQILSNISSLQKQLNNGAFAARAIYAWNSDFIYGANEITFYPEEGKFGSFVKSIAENNTRAPYNADGTINSAYWEVVVDFDTISEAYFQSVQEAVSQAQNAVEAAEHFAGQAEEAAETIGRWAGNAVQFVDVLPAVGDPNYLYAVVSEQGEGLFNLYGWDNGQWVQLGTAGLTANVARVYEGILTADGWSGGQQTLSVPELTTQDDVQVSPVDAGAQAYIENGVNASQIVAGGIVFTCQTPPAINIGVNVYITTEQTIPNTSGFYTKDQINALAAGGASFTIDSETFVITFMLKAIDGTELYTNSIDLPLESVVVGGSYDEDTKTIVLTLQNGNTIDIPVADIVDGLASQTALDAETAARISADDSLGERIDALDARLPTSETLTLAASAWENNRQDVLVEGVTATNNIIVYPTDASAAAYVLSDVNITQADGKIVFTCVTAPTADITVVVDISA